ncbi:hypothetical protein I79_025963 [Cricetulus griseus]|uniref:Uncharacterized protein n=1 Tax=Cricetulus griseus TaxID=10029 RepID=G3IPP3_CRIGR|nr:hypothetical protein I79_025963 [Cricetulus griseus]
MPPLSIASGIFPYSIEFYCCLLESSSLCSLDDSLSAEAQRLGAMRQLLKSVALTRKLIF